jgi:hypothetical protein
MRKKRQEMLDVQCSEARSEEEAEPEKKIKLEAHIKKKYFQHGAGSGLDTFITNNCKQF